VHDCYFPFMQDAWLKQFCNISYLKYGVRLGLVLGLRVRLGFLLMYIIGFLIIIILSNCIGMDWSRNLQLSPVMHYFSAKQIARIQCMNANNVDKLNTAYKLAFTCS